MDELCPVTAKAEHVNFRSREAAQTFLDKMDIGTAGRLSIVERGKGYSLAGTVFCLGYHSDRRQTGGGAALADTDLCVVLKLRKLGREKGFSFTGTCVLLRNSQEQ